MSDPAALSLAAAAQALRARHVSSRELADACLARIARWQPCVNAFISVEQQPAEEGVPLAHKDMFYRKGRVSNCGSKIRRGWIAHETSTALSRLDAAGMPQIGTLNMAEFAYGPTGHNEHWGDCRNPWNQDYIAGGSRPGRHPVRGRAAGIRYALRALHYRNAVRSLGAACALDARAPRRLFVRGPFTPRVGLCRSGSRLPRGPAPARGVARALLYDDACQRGPLSAAGDESARSHPGADRPARRGRHAGAAGGSHSAYALGQLSRRACARRSLRFRFARPAHRPAARRPPVRGGRAARGRARLPVRNRLAL